MKKIIVGIFSFALLFSAQAVFASGWNEASNDCPTISIINYTTNQGYVNPCWPLSSISASPGDTINVRVYYHNTGTQTANNTRVFITPPTGTSSSKSFTGSITSDQGSLSFGPVTANLSSAQTLTFYSVKWYTNNTSETLTPLLNGQTGAEIISGGLSLGSIANGWSTQGSLVLAFKVGSTVVPPPAPLNCTISTFNANPASITAGQSSTLTWNTNNCTSVSLSGIGNVYSTNQVVYPMQTTSYTLTAYGSNGSQDTRTLTVTVVPVPVQNCVISSFTANPTSISANGTSTLSWNTTNCVSATISNLGYNVPVSGSQTVYPYQTTTYTLTAYGQTGAPQTASVTVTVASVPVQNCVINTFNANPTSISANGSSTLNWNTSNCVSATISNLGYNTPVSGSQVIYPAQTTTYVLTASGSSGAPQTASVTVTVTSVPVQNCVISNFTANPTSISANGSSTLSWNTTNCVSATISNLGYNVPVSGSQTVYPANTTTYTLTAYGQNGTQQTQSVTVTVAAVVQNCAITNFNASPMTINSGSGSTLSWTTSNCGNASISTIGSVSLSGSQTVYPSVTTRYIITAYGNDWVEKTQGITVTVNAIVQPLNCAINSFSASPTSISANGSSTLSWNTTNCISATISNLGYNVPVSGSQVIYPTQTTTYTLTAIGQNSTQQTQSVTVTVASYVPPVQNCAINSFTASPTYIEYGGGTTLSWRTSNCTEATLFDGEDTVYLSNIASGSGTVYPVQSTTFTITAHGSDWVDHTRSVTVFVSTYTPPVQNCYISNFSASPTVITSGGSSTLSWNTSNCTSATISNLGYNVPVSGSQAVYPSQTTTYVLTAYGSNGIPQTQSVTVATTTVVVQNNCLITNFSASPAYINAGSSTMLTWNTTNCVSVDIVGLGINAFTGINGTQTISPASSGSYVLNAHASSGAVVTQTLYVIVNPIVVPLSCAISNFSASPTSITLGQSSTLSWNTSNCTSAIISNLGYNIPVSGSQAVYPTQTTTYLLTAYGPNGTQQSQSVTVATTTVVVVPVNNCAITNFTASPNFVTSSLGSVLSWNTTNCTNANISTLGAVAVSSSQTVYPSATTTYVLTAYGNNWINQTQSVKVSVNTYVPVNNCAISNFSANPSSINTNGSSTLNWNTTNCTSATISNLGYNVPVSGSQVVYPTVTTTYLLSAYGTNGIPQTQSVTVAATTVNVQPTNNCTIYNFTANQTSVTSGTPVTLNWNTNGCTSASISGIGNVGLSGSQLVYPAYTTNYVLTTYGPNGAQQAQTVYVTVNPVIVQNPVVNACAVTTIPTNVTRNSAQLNGLVTSGNGSTTTYFEYGPTVSMGSQTVARSVGGNSPFTEFVSNLSPNTIYYFRLVSTCGNGGLSRGTIEILNTLGNPVTVTTGGTQTVRQVVVQGTTVVGTSSPIMLKIENRYEAIGVGDTIDYTVTYKNIGSSLLTRPILQVVAPKGITLTNASRGTYAPDTNTLTVQLEDLYPGAEGTVFIQGRVDTIEPNTAQIVSTAVLVYTSPSGAQENAIAYALNKPKEAFGGNTLGASAFFAGIFPTSLLGWLLLIIIILLLILLARRYYPRSQTVTHTTTTTSPPPIAHY